MDVDFVWKGAPKNEGLFKFSDKIFLKFLGQDVLKFVKSYDYFIRCKDMHKSYQAIEIMLFGIVMELIRTYGASVTDPTALGFLKWTAATENPNQKFMCQFLLIMFWPCISIRWATVLTPDAVMQEG